jgi:hypothetical protein
MGGRHVMQAGKWKPAKQTGTGFISEMFSPCGHTG